MDLKEFIRDPWVVLLTGFALGIIAVLFYQGWVIPSWNKFKKYLKKNKVKVMLRTVVAFMVLGLIGWIIILMEGKW